MKNVWKFIRHNSGICLGIVLAPLILIYAYSCQSMVVSSINPTEKINRTELVNEVDFFLAQAEAKFTDLDRQDLVKDTIFNSVFELAQGQAPSPTGIMLAIGNVLGLGAVIDNVRKRTHINTLKGESLNAKVKEKLKEILQPTEK